MCDCFGLFRQFMPFSLKGRDGGRGGERPFAFRVRR